MFNKLLSLYQSHTSGTRTPLEQFTTEAFCGVLRSDSALLEGFLQAFAGIENETGFSVKTEISYPHNGSTCRIDVVIENRNYLIFLENKVETGEGSRREIGQLEAYANILKTQNKKTLLLFCTKYQETKNSELYKPIPFKQFLWRDIYSFISKSNFNQKDLVQLFLKYLEKQNMSKALEFTLEDLAALNRIPTILRSLQECLDQVRPCFQKYFGEIEPRSLQESNRDKDYNLYYRTIYNSNKYSIQAISNLLKDKSAWSGLTLFIPMGDDRHPNNPRLMLEFGINNKHKDYEAVKFEFYKQKACLADVIFSERDWGLVIQYTKSLSSFLSEDEQFQAIKLWCEERLLLLHHHMTQHSQVEWDIKSNP